MKTPAGYPPTRHSTQSPHRTAGTQRHGTTSIRCHRIRLWFPPKLQRNDNETTTSQKHVRNKSETGSQSRNVPEKSPEHPVRAPGQIVQFRLLNATAGRQSGRVWWDVRRVGKWIPRSVDSLIVMVLCQESTSKVGQDVRWEFLEKQFPTGKPPRNHQYLRQDLPFLRIQGAELNEEWVS